MSDPTALEQSRLLYSLLGDLPDRERSVSAQVISSTSNDNYIIEKLELDLNGFETVPAYFVKPIDASEPTPCILYNHAHGNNYEIGKEELLSGRKAIQQPAYAEMLTSLGFSALCFDTWCFGERQHKSESETFKEMLWKGQVLWGMMVYDSLKAVDYLLTRNDVDSERIGTLGLSMGSTMAWWLAALDTRIKSCIDICCLTDYDSLISSGNLDKHGIYYYVPSLLKHFSAADINVLIAPRPHLSLAGLQDPLTPVDGLEKIDNAIKVHYTKLNASKAWQLKTYNVGHKETPEMRQDIVNFLQKWL